MIRPVIKEQASEYFELHSKPSVKTMNTSFNIRDISNKTQSRFKGGKNKFVHEFKKQQKVTKSLQVPKEMILAQGRSSSPPKPKKSKSPKKQSLDRPKMFLNHNALNQLNIMRKFPAKKESDFSKMFKMSKQRQIIDHNFAQAYAKVKD